MALARCAEGQDRHARDALGPLIHLLLLPGPGHDKRDIVPRVRNVAFGRASGRKARDANELIGEDFPRNLLDAPLREAAHFNI